MSFWDDIFNKPFGGLFDVNGDGKEDIGEQWLAYQWLTQFNKKKEDPLCHSSDDGFDSDFDDDFGDCDCQDFCEDNSVYDSNPEDYETEEQYAKAPEEEYDGLCGADEDDGEYGEQVKESDYPNKRRYNAAVILSNPHTVYCDEEYEKLQKSCCRFISEQADNLAAANYLTPDGDFLFSQAVRNHFSLPVSLPYEDEESKLSLPDILRKIEKEDVPLALDVWNWCVEQFLPYIEYAPRCRAAMTNDLLDGVCLFSDEFQASLPVFLDEHADFREKIIRECDAMPISMSELIIKMIQGGYAKTAEAMFDDGLFRANGSWEQIDVLMGGLIFLVGGVR